jgi:lipopolysaccharide biosynthesis regulator YciM
MLVRLLLIIILIVISLFCWLSLLNPVDIEFHFFGETFPTDLSTLMISSFVLGAMLVFLSTLARDAKRAIEGYRKSRQKKKEQVLKEELNKGMEAFLRGNLTRAKAHFREILERDSSQVDLYLRLSEIALREGDEEEALRWLEKATLVDTRNVDILLSQAALYRRMQQPDEAIRTLTRAVTVDESNLKAQRGLREIYVESQRWEEAVRVQKSILKFTTGKQAEEEETLVHLGLKYEHARASLDRSDEDRLEGILKEAKEIVRERKTFQPGFVLLGDTYLRMGKWAIAGKVWGKSFMRFKSIVFLLRLEELYLGRGDPNTLLRIYQRALKNNPDGWVTAFFYAKLCLRLEMLDEALEELDEISLRRKDFPALHRLLAEIYLHKKDFGRAAQEFEKTFEMSSPSYLPFFCTHCGRESKEWVGHCPQCHRWSTYTINEGEKILPFPSLAFSERTHFPLK